MHRRLLPALFLCLLSVVGLARGSEAPLRLFLRGGPKTHGPGEHEHEKWLTEWSALLRARGAVVEGALRHPTPEELERCDVLVVYAAEAGTVRGEDREALERFLERGGGIAVLHDGVCGEEPGWYQTVIGGAWEHGHSKWLIEKQGLYVVDDDHPIVRGVANYDLADEIYYDLHMDSQARVLMSSFRTPFDVEPQMWTLERGKGRAFVNIQGHYWTTFSHPSFRALALRGIAWAGGRDVDTFLTPEEVQALRYPPGGPTAPERAHESMVLHPDFELSLVAAEPLVVNPISLDWDARGRLWVACTPGYPYKQEFSGVPAHDEVLVLRDEDGDGRMDASTVFADGLDLVTSLVLHEDGVIVSQAPELLWLRDTDGDGRCDTREVLFSGFGYGDTHAVISNLRWGRDGWVYGTQGYSGNASRHVTNAAGRDFGHVGNGLFRFKPDGSAIEVVSSYGSNTWGCDFDREGELFYTMANGSHLRHVVLPERVLGGGRVGGVNSWTHVPDHREAHAILDESRTVYQQIDFVGGFTAAAGSNVYDSAAWPEEFQGDHYVTEPTLCLVHRDALAPRGVTFTASRVREPEFLASTDLWFRPIGTRTGPDGALYVLDFYNQAAVHNDTRGPQHGPTNAAVRPDRDKHHGRIWRVQHRAAKPLPAPADAGDVAALVDALGAPSSWQKDTAERRLRELWRAGDAADLDARLARACRESASVDQRLRGLGLLHTLQPEAPRTRELVARGLDDADARVRRNAARIARDVELDATLEDALVRALAGDDARLRLLAAAALGGRTLAPTTFQALVGGYGAADDDWTRTELLRALSGDLDLALDAALGTDARDLARELATRLGRARDAGRTGRALVAVAGARAEVAAEVLEALVAAWPESEARPADEPTLDGLRRLFAARDLRVASAAVALAQRLDTTGALDPERAALAARLVAELESPDLAYADALVRLGALLAMPSSRAAALARCDEFLAAAAPLDVTQATIARLAALDDPAAGATLARNLPAMTSAARDAALGALFARDAWVAALLDEVEAGAVRRIDLGPRRVHALTHHPTAALAARARAALADPNAANVDELVARFLPVVREAGDAEHGKALFAEHCATCHRFGGEGAEVGPSLEGIGAHGKEFLLPIVLDPNREVASDFVEFVARTYDGRTQTGIVVRETPDSVVLRHTDGDHEIARADLESLRSSGLSLMPTGFDSIGAEGLRDLFTYLTAPFAGYRILDLSPVFNVNTAKGLYDPAKDGTTYRFARTGVFEHEGVPMELVDPATAKTGFNCLILEGGPYDDWASQRDYPRQVEVPVGGVVGRVHVLGAVAGWGYPWGNGSGEPIVRWTWVYEDGAREEVVLHNGVEFADWIGRYDVPGSTLVEGLVGNDSYGQVRTFALTPARDEPVARIELASFDNHLAPTFFGLTVEAPGLAPQVDEPVSLAPPQVLILGGGSSHDFERWFDEVDVATLASVGLDTRYTSRPADLATQLGPDTVLVLCTNQPLDAATTRRITEHVTAGGGLLALHPGTWRNWADWPEHAGVLLGGDTQSHEAYAAFDVGYTKAGLAWLSRSAAPFTIEDELYREELRDDADVTVLATATSRSSGKTYPVLWSTTPGKGRVIGFTLGHDGAAHEHPSYRALLVCAVAWLRQ